MTEFNYPIMIRTNPNELWKALLEPEQTRQYWYGCVHRTSWQVGSVWQLVNKAGLVTNAGHVREFISEHRLVLDWRNEFVPELTAEGFGTVAFEVRDVGSAVELNLRASTTFSQSKWLKGIAAPNGWGAIVSSLKSLLETGESLEQTREWPS